MSNEEIVEHIQNGIDLTLNQERLWGNNHRFVRMIIIKYVGSTCDKQDMEDYMQQGFIGLITAATKFNPDKNVKFLTYAEYHIRTAIFRYNGYNTSTINIPDYIKLRMRNLEQFKREFREEFKREPQECEIQERLNISIKSIRSLEKMLLQMRTKSLDNYVFSEDKTELVDMISTDEDIETLIGSTEDNKRLHQVLNQALSELDEQTKQMIMHVYYQGAAVRETAHVFKCSRQSVHNQINKGFYQIIHGKYCKILETFMWDGYHVNPKRLSNYVDTEEIDSIECDLLIMEEV